MTSDQIEYALSLYFNWRQHIIVPNVWWGLGLNHECDLLIITKSGFAYEVEIKINKYDLRRDVKKRHLHSHYKIKKLYFAIPETLLTETSYIPEHAGILIVKDSGLVNKFREAKTQSGKPLTDKDILKVAHLGCMRIWKLKHNLINYHAESSFPKSK